MKAALVSRLALGLSLTLAAVLAPPASPRAEGLDDAVILSIFDQANMADITTARLGYRKGHAPEVRALAKMVLTDHEAVQQMGRDLGKALDLIAVPPEPDGALGYAGDYARLQTLSGPAFDRAYLAYEIAFHQGVIAALNGSLLPAIEHPAFRELVQNVLPGFEHHLAETRKVAKNLGYID